MNKRYAFLAAVSLTLCGCDLSSPTEKNECASAGESVAGLIVNDLFNASVPPEFAGIFQNGFCPGEYQCLEYHGKTAQKACYRCPQHNQIFCNNSCVDGLGTDPIGHSTDHCGSCDVQCDATTQICSNGMCTSKCQNQCKSKYLIEYCDTNSMQDTKTCIFGCIHTDEGDKCLENECGNESECVSSNELMVCGGTPLEMRETCYYGCVVKANVAQCETCHNQCLPDGTLMLCDENNPYAAATETHCPLGCSSETYSCNPCIEHCSEDGTVLYSCETEYAAHTAVDCPFGCSDAHCNEFLDADGDGVDDQIDVCPNNGQIWEGEDVDCSTLQNKVFYIYNAKNFVELRTLLSQSPQPEIKAIRFENDVNFGQLNTSNADGKCVVEPNLDMAHYPTGLSFSNITVEGNGKTIRASKSGKRCSLRSAIFDRIEKGTIKELNLDIDVGESGRALLVNEIPFPINDNSVQLIDITIKGNIDTDAEDYESSELDNFGNPMIVRQPVGGLVAHIEGSIPEHNSTTKQPHFVTRCVADGVRINAPKAKNVGGLFGYAEDVAYITSDRPHRIISVTGRENVGGIAGQANISNHKPADSPNTSLIRAEIGEVHGILNVGGFAGYGDARNVVLSIASVTGGDAQNTAENVGGIIGYTASHIFGSSGLQNNTADIGTIESNGSNTGGLTGYINGSNITLKENYTNIGEIHTSGNNTGLVIGMMSDIPDINIEVIDHYAQANIITGKEYISGGIANCPDGLKYLMFESTILRANMTISDDTVHYSGLTNCEITGDKLYLNNIVTVVTSQAKDAGMKLDKALFSSDLQHVLDLQEESPQPPALLFNCTYWYNLGAKDSSSPGINDFSSYSGRFNSGFYSFDKDNASTLAIQQQCMDITIFSDHTSEWKSMSFSQFSTFDYDGDAVTANFPAYHPEILDELEKLHRIEQ